MFFHRLWIKKSGEPHGKGTGHGHGNWLSIVVRWIVLQGPALTRA